MVMMKTNIHEAKARLSEFIEQASRGEHIVICRHNKPVAELRAVEDVRATPRPIGPLPGRPRFDVPASFFEPMGDDEIALWEGGALGAPVWSPESEPVVSKVAGAPSTYRTPRRRSSRRP